MYCTPILNVAALKNTNDNNSLNMQ